MKNKIIGVIGGMGPQASVEFYRLLIVGAKHRYGAYTNDAYPEIVIDSVPVSDFLSNREKMEEAALMLEDRVRRLTEYGVSAITMTCNTACILANRLQQQTTVPFISVIDEVVQAVTADGRKVLLLGSPMSLRLGLYQVALARSDVSYVVPRPRDYQELEFIIRGVLAGEDRGMLLRKLVKMVTGYREKENIGGIVLGCTELPLVFPLHYDLLVYNSLSILANALLKRYYTKEVV